MENSRIIDERKKLGLSQAELASKLKISQKSISKYERGTRRPSYETLLAMSSIFGVSVDYLLGNENSTLQTLLRTSEKKEDKGFSFFNNNLKNKFVERLKKAIADNKISVQDLANNASIDLENCTAYINGEQEPTLEDLINLSCELNVSIDYLLGGISELDNKALCRLKKLEDDNDKDIIIGEINKLIKEQRLESVAADSIPLKKTGTDNPK